VTPSIRRHEKLEGITVVLDRILALSKRYSMPVMLFVIFVSLLIRNSGLHPMVMGDEYAYSLWSRLLPLADAHYPDYAYLTIYHLTSTCGNDFLSCARTFNALFFVAAGPFIYLVARRVCTKGVATFITIIALLGPIDTYTAFFMPEALYFLCFWIVTFYILRLDSSSGGRSWFTSGVLIGFTALVKPHALFLLPAISIYVLYLSRPRGRSWFKSGLKNIFLLVISTAFTKFLGGYLLAGKAGLTLFGLTYGSISDSTTSSLKHLIALIPLILENVKGHTLALCLVYGFSLFVTIHIAVSASRSKDEPKQEGKLAIFALLIIFSLIFVVGLFTASADSVYRLHMRYYDFALPLLLIVTASRLSSRVDGSTLKGSGLLVFPIAGASIFALVTHMAPYAPNSVDSPELNAFTSNWTVAVVLGGLSLLCLTLWVFKSSWGYRAFIFGFLPLAVVLSFSFVWDGLRPNQELDSFDQAAIFAKAYLPKEELGGLQVVGSSPGGLYRSLFQIDNRDASLEIIQPGSNYDLSKMPSGKEWALIIGDHTWTGGAFFDSPTKEYALVRRSDPEINVDFTKNIWPGVISSAKGLGGAEKWGTASSGPLVTLEFAVALPQNFVVHLSASAFGPNVGKEFIARVGLESLPFTLGSARQDVNLNFNNPGLSNVIQIIVPFPISPKALGINGDERVLGINLTSLRVTPK
jgi:phosphoglycerol transferase